MSLTGYLHPGYAQALSEFGTPRELPRSGAWFLERTIPGCADVDGMGCYPYLACQDWSELASDLEALGTGLVSFAATPDPFGRYTPADLERAFPDGVTHFKDHHVADLSRPLEQIVPKHRRRRAESALSRIEVECCAEPLRFLDTLMGLFELTIRKFHITGVRAYSRASLAEQLALPGCYVSLARYRGEAIGAEMFFVHGETAYAHLAGATEEANALGAVSARHYTEIRYFADKVRWIDWGGDAGIAGSETSLGRFKRGWSTQTRPVYFCARVLDRGRYDRITRARGVDASHYFPAYRAGEFG